MRQAITTPGDEDNTLMRRVGNRIDCLLQSRCVVGDTISLCAEAVIRKIDGGLVFQANRVKRLRVCPWQNGGDGKSDQR
jgi:hypothetical protein